jgi:hypothetical protein
VTGEKELEKKGEINDSHRKLGVSTIELAETSKSPKSSDKKMKQIDKSGTDDEKIQISHATKKTEKKMPVIPTEPVKANKNCNIKN